MPFRPRAGPVRVTMTHIGDDMDENPRWPIREAMADPDRAPPFSGDSLEAVLPQETLRNTAGIVDRARERLSPACDPAREGHRISLGNLLRMRFEVTGHLGDVTAAIGLPRDVLQVVADDAPRCPAYSLLGLALLDQYIDTGRPADLDAATEAARNAMAGSTSVTPTAARCSPTWPPYCTHASRHTANSRNWPRPSATRSTRWPPRRPISTTTP